MNFGEEKRTPTTKRPLGSIRMMALIFFAIFGIILIGNGFNDMRNDEATGFWFFVGWLFTIGAVMYWAVTRPPKDPPSSPTYIKD